MLNYLKKFLSQIGVNSHVPLAYRYAPSKYQGLESLNAQVKQFIEKLKIFIMHAGTESQMGHTIKIMLENINLMVGVNKFMFKTSFKDYKIISEEGWI